MLQMDDLVITMSISKLTTQSSVEISSSLTPPSSINSNTPEETALRTRNTTDGLSLWYSILDAYSKEILDCASNQFLDLVIARRLDTISTRDLVCLLLKARRLGYKGADVAKGKRLGPLPYRADEGLSASFASTLPGEGTGNGRSDSTTSSEPYPVEASRERKRWRSDDHGSYAVDSLPYTKRQPTRPGPTSLETQASNDLKRRKCRMRMGEQSLTASGNPSPGPGAKGRPPDPKSRERLHSQRDVHNISSSDRNQS